MIVRVPASSANLGPGFDTLGMALSLYVDAGVIDGEPPAGAQRIDQFHPAGVAFRRAGGEGELWVCSPIPVGRGLGFSGAVRIAGIVAAHAQRHGSDPDEMADSTPAMLALATELEGHADNVAASLFGGIVATADGRAVQIPLAFDPAIVVWIPSSTTSTDESRAKLGREVLALATRSSTSAEPRCSLPRWRPAMSTPCAVRRKTGSIRIGAWPQPSRRRRHSTRLSPPVRGARGCRVRVRPVAAMCPLDDADDLAAQMPVGGHTKVLRIDHGGAVIEAAELGGLRLGLRQGSTHDLGHRVDRPLPPSVAPQDRDAVGESLDRAGEAEHLVDDVAGEQLWCRRHLRCRQRQTDLQLCPRWAVPTSTPWLHVQHGVPEQQADVAGLAEPIGEALTAHRIGEGHCPIANLSRLLVATLG